MARGSLVSRRGPRGSQRVHSPRDDLETPRLASAQAGGSVQGRTQREIVQVGRHRNSSTCWRRALVPLRVPSSHDSSTNKASFLLNTQCEAIPASWSLPQYSFEPPKTRVKRTTSQTSRLCLCEYSHAEALEMYGKVINEAGERVIPPGGMDGKDKGRRRRKSPAVSALPSYS